MPSGRSSAVLCSLRGSVRTHGLHPAPLVSANYRMKLTGRGRRFATAPRQPGGARDGLGNRAATLQLMRGR
jgi:hypothetical protein